MQINPDILSELVAPDISLFTEATIPDLTNQFPHPSMWVIGHFLNSLLRGTFGPKARQVVLSYQRRTYHAFDAYHKARDATFNYLEGNEPYYPSVGKYYGAVAFWETFTLQTQMALDLIKWLQKGKRIFSKNDGSKEQRLYTISNQVKHLDSHVKSPNFSPADTVPLWLSNTGLHSFGVQVTYTEASEMLINLAELAEELQDPLTFTQSKKA